jgi:hypothetical protein
LKICHVCNGTGIVTAWEQSGREDYKELHTLLLRERNNNVIKLNYDDNLIIGHAFSVFLPSLELTGQAPDAKNGGIKNSMLQKLKTVNE